MIKIKAWELSPNDKFIYLNKEIVVTSSKIDFKHMKTTIDGFYTADNKPFHKVFRE